jgi:hypothetical protein|tara:strand:- start:1161 stop:1385 length:225 start_codon:yes stop_codon:yes gene_type:complete
MNIYRATIDVFHMIIFAHSESEAKDYFMDKSINFPTVRVGDQIFLRLGESGDGDIEITFEQTGTFDGFISDGDD